MWILLLGLVFVIVLFTLTDFGKDWTIAIAIIAIFVGLYAVLVVIGGLNNLQNEPKSTRPENLVMSFIQEMNPELNQKISKIKKEIVVADNKIQQLHELKKAFPNQAKIIEQKVKQWQTLKEQLSQVSNSIYQKVERAYVSYKIDEIQGRNKFGAISEELLKEANAILANAEATKSTIEEQIDE